MSFDLRQAKYDFLQGTTHPMLEQWSGFFPASPSVPPFIPLLALIGLSRSSVLRYLCEIKLLVRYVQQLGLPWPLALDMRLIVNFLFYSVLVRKRSSCCIDRILSVVSRLADSHEVYCSPRSDRDGRLIRRVKRFLMLLRPRNPKGRDPIPDPANFVPRMLAHLTDSPVDEIFLVRFLLILNTGMRAAECSWENLMLSDLVPAFDDGGRLLYIIINIRFSKTSKTTTEPLMKVVFYRTDPLDVMRPLLLFLRRWHSISLRALPLAPGESQPPLGPTNVPLFPCLKPNVQPKYRASKDTEFMTMRMRQLAAAAGMPAKKVTGQGIHGCRSTFTTMLIQAGGTVPFAEQVVGWNAKKHASATKYLREAAHLTHWIQVNKIFSAYLSPSASA